MFLRVTLTLALFFSLMGCSVFKPATGEEPHLPDDCCGQIRPIPMQLIPICTATPSSPEELNHHC